MGWGDLGRFRNKRRKKTEPVYTISLHKLSLGHIRSCLLLNWTTGPSNSVSSTVTGTSSSWIQTALPGVVGEQPCDFLHAKALPLNFSLSHGCITLVCSWRDLKIICSHIYVCVLIKLPANGKHNVFRSAQNVVFVGEDLFSCSPMESSKCYISLESGAYYELALHEPCFGAPSYRHNLSCCGRSAEDPEQLPLKLPLYALHKAIATPMDS